MRSKILLIAISLCLPFVLSAKKTTTKSRMTGATFRTYTQVAPTGLYITDTDVYVYSGYNGGAVVNKGTPLANNWVYSGIYDTLVRRRFDTVSTHMNFYLRDRTMNHYVGTNKNLDTSLYQRYDTAAHVYNNYSRSIYTYDGSNNTTMNLTQYWVASAWKDSLVHLYTYDGSNNMLTDTSKNLGNSINNTLSIYHYNTNAVDTQTIMNWNAGAYALTSNSRRYTYFLNSSSHLADSSTYMGWSTTSMIWRPTNGSTRDHYTRDGGGNVVLDSGWSYFGGWYLSINSYTYTGGDMITDTAKSNFGGPLTYTSYQVNTYDGSHRQLTSEKWMWNGSAWRDSALYTNGYNSFGQDTIYMTQTRVGGSWVFTRTSTGFGGFYNDVKNLYYYTTYIDPTGVEMVNANKGDLKLYPVPANTMLNIDLKWETAQLSAIAVYDMNGRLWMQWDAGKTDHYTHTLYTSQLPAGNYIIKVRGEESEAAQPFVIVR